VRGEVRKMIEHTGGPGSFIEVFVDCPVGVCETRDVKGLYAKARSGEIKQFTGVNDPYEPPHNPEIRIDTSLCTPQAGADKIIDHIRSKGLVKI